MNIPRHELEVLERELREMQRDANKKCGALWEPDKKASAYLHSGRSQGIGVAADRLRALLDKYEDEK